MYLSLREVRCLLYRSLLMGYLYTARVLLKLEEVSVAIVQIVFRMAHKHAQTRTLTKHRSWLPQRGYLEMRLLLHHGCYNVQSLEDGVIHAHQQQQTEQQK